MAFSNSAYSSAPMAGMKRALDAANEDETEMLDGDAGTKTVKKQSKRVKMDKEAFQNKLISSDGIQRIYSDFRSLKFKGKGHERRDMRLLMSRYEEWAYKLMPILTFDDVILKVEAVGGTMIVNSAISAIRDVEMDKHRVAAGEETFEPFTNEDAGGAPAALLPAGGAPLALEGGAAALRIEGGAAEEEEEEDPGLHLQAAEAAEAEEDWEEDMGANYVEDDEEVAVVAKKKQATPPPVQLTEEMLERIATNKRMALERLAASKARAAAAHDAPPAPAAQASDAPAAAAPAAVEVVNVAPPEGGADSDEEEDDSSDESEDDEEPPAGVPPAAAAAPATPAPAAAASSDESGSDSEDEGAGAGGLAALVNAAAPASAAKPAKTPKADAGAKPHHSFESSVNSSTVKNAFDDETAEGVLASAVKPAGKTKRSKEPKAEGEADDATRRSTRARKA
eukprot:CAMPEP_0180404674 /NCGR_PEP_ID=MMETSP0989-20121125/40170_1 /TAXON_ID=697907 /ORGANISM="non described non described, Strain CCMP2293" /LENGTH=451 /DNA_ID=CAMNT_0022408163 /DNA_START=65 /DNA_END=1420 /DNA_ORIENTATION=+